MPHPDPDDLALVALGEQLDPSPCPHRRVCGVHGRPRPRGTIDLAGLSDYGADAPAPDEYVWDAIADELGFGGHAAGPVNGASRPGCAARGPCPEPMDEVGDPDRRRGDRHRDRRGRLRAVRIGEKSVDVEATARLTPVPGGPLPESDGQLGTADLVTARRTGGAGGRSRSARRSTEPTRSGCSATRGR